MNAQKSTQEQVRQSAGTLNAARQESEDEPGYLTGSFDVDLFLASLFQVNNRINI